MWFWMISAISGSILEVQLHRGLKRLRWVDGSIKRWTISITAKCRQIWSGSSEV